MLAATAARPPIPASVTPLPASADKELPVRCLIYASVFATDNVSSAEDRELGTTMRAYWLGRVNAELPGKDAVELIPAVALRLKVEAIESEQIYCAQATADHIADLERGESQLNLLREAAVEAQKKAK